MVIEKIFARYHKTSLQLLAFARTISIMLSAALIAGIYLLLHALLHRHITNFCNPYVAYRLLS